MRPSGYLLISCAFLAGCGGGSDGGGSSGGTPIVSTPTPGPSSTPTPTPTSTPTPAQVSVTYPHVFVASGDGGQPNGPLLQASDGNFYGTTHAGGGGGCRVGCGVLFKLTPAGDETVLHSFGIATTYGERPSGPPIQGQDGALYGITSGGGAYEAGSFYKIALAGAYSLLYSFGSSPTDGNSPTGSLIQGSDGNFYGLTASGGANHCINVPQAGGNCGTVFSITPAGVETVLYSFGAGLSDGVEPSGALVQANDGNFYGTTQNGGTNACSTTGERHDCGTIFRVTPAGVTTILYSFGATTADGEAPIGSLIQAADGDLYGATLSGGGGRCGSLFGCGVIFKITTGGILTNLYAFSTNSTADGNGPSPLIQAKDGSFYGTTASGGAYGGDLLGTVFRLTPAGALTTLYSFGPDLVGPNSTPSQPLGGVMQAADGTFYGVTAYNGQLGAVGAQTGQGAIFKMVVR